VSDPALSLVICTRNRVDRLRSCLHAVADIRSSQPCEVVVVDNASTDDTPGVVEAARETFPVPLRLVEEPIPGIARARNRGWRSAAAAIVAYTNDDCYPTPDLIDLILDRFEHDLRLGYLGGSVLRHDPSDALVTILARRDAVELHPGGFVTPGTLIGANLAFRRVVLEAIGGFDVVFGYGAGFAGEDVDAIARAAAAGWRGLYDPGLVVRHHHGRRPGPEAEQLRRAHDVGRDAFFAKCALDRRMRRKYLAGWLRLTAGRARRREDLRPFARELWGAVRYFALRLRGAAAA
jgi:GT2 family glycosyltransferase